MNTIQTTHPVTGTYEPIGRRIALALAEILRLDRAATRPQSPSRWLPKGETQWVERPLGREVVCEQGRIWLTFDHQPQDIVLVAGQTHACATGARLSVHAIEASRFKLR